MKLADLHARRIAGELTFVGRGLRLRGGKLSDQVCTIVGVREKLPMRALVTNQAIPRQLDDAPDTDVQAMNFKAGKARRSARPAELARPLSLVSRQRPCPAGYSIGHYLITAGTLGLVVRVAGRLVGITNAHVAANVNKGVVGDPIYQPGPHDGGHASDTIATLADSVAVTFGSPIPDPGKKKNKAARALWWNPLLGLANAGARLSGCDLRAALVKGRPRQAVAMPFAGVRLIQQGNPNDVDYCQILFGDEADVLPAIYKLGPITSGRDAVLGDGWEKMGRTTEHTTGIVSAIGSSAVDYGDEGTAQYQEQLVLRNPDGQQTSAGGDSGSCIKWKGDGASRAVMLGLLFAGDDAQGITLACRYSQLQRYLPFEFIP